MAPGVRLKRGAGAGCTAPFDGREGLRGLLDMRMICNFVKSSTGVRHASNGAAAATHSSRVFVLKIAAQPLSGLWPVPALVKLLRYRLVWSSSPVSASKLRVELRLHRAHRNVTSVRALVRPVIGSRTIERSWPTADRSRYRWRAFPR